MKKNISSLLILNKIVLFLCLSFMFFFSQIQAQNVNENCHNIQFKKTETSEKNCNACENSKEIITKNCVFNDDEDFQKNSKNPENDSNVFMNLFSKNPVREKKIKIEFPPPLYLISQSPVSEKIILRN